MEATNFSPAVGARAGGAATPSETAAICTEIGGPTATYVTSGERSRSAPRWTMQPSRRTLLQVRLVSPSVHSREPATMSHPSWRPIN